MRWCIGNISLYKIKYVRRNIEQLNWNYYGSTDHHFPWVNLTYLLDSSINHHDHFEDCYGYILIWSARNPLSTKIWTCKIHCLCWTSPLREPVIAVMKSAQSWYLGDAIAKEAISTLQSHDLICFQDSYRSSLNSMCRYVTRIMSSDRFLVISNVLWLL